MQFFRHRIAAIAAGLWIIGMISSVTGQTSLASRVPHDANIMLILNVEKIMGSQIAQEKSWKTNRAQAVETGLTILPASANRFLMAAKMDLEFMQPQWEIALSYLDHEPQIAQIAANWKGEIDNIDSHSAVKLGDDSYVVAVGPRKLAAMSPANRQQVARWLRSTSQSTGDHHSPYIQQALRYVDELGTPIILAVDLGDVVAPANLVKMKSLSSFTGDKEDAAKRLASIRGATLGINVTDHVGGALVVDFTEDISDLKGMLKPLVLETLAIQGASIDEFAEWKEVVEGKRFRLLGRLNKSGFQRLMSLMSPPPAIRSYHADPKQPASKEETAKLASQQYFKSVTGLIDDLQKHTHHHSGSTTTGLVGTWYERYAKRVDSLPILDVDPLLLDYGHYVATQLRGGGEALREVGGKQHIRQMNAPQHFQTYGRWGMQGNYADYWSPWSEAYQAEYTVEDFNQEQHDRLQIKTEERAKGAKSAHDSMQRIAEATADVRRKLTEKYHAEF